MIQPDRQKRPESLYVASANANEVRFIGHNTDKVRRNHQRRPNIACRRSGKQDHGGEGPSLLSPTAKKQNKMCVAMVVWARTA